jgi:hypothetical protein
MMNKQKNSNLTFVQFLLKAQYLAQEETRSDKGYAMMMTSIISIAMLSMLAAYMTMTNLSKSSTNAYVDGTNTFYTAESGLNKRASLLLERFLNNTTPTGTSPGGMQNCYPITADIVPGADDFECRNYKFRYNNNIAADRGSDGSTVLSEQDGNGNSVNYIANTYVKNNTIASTNAAIAPNPEPSTIPSGQAYAGLKALEYRYTVYATAIKPNTVNATTSPGFTTDEIVAKGKATPTPAEVLLVNSYNSKKAAADAANAASGAISSTSNTVLQMDFKSRIVPLFQFAAFYDGDLEINTGSDMTLSGPVHTNKNLYILPFGAFTLSLGGKVTAAGRIYNRVDSYGYSAGGITRMLLNGNNCSVAGNCLPDYVATNTGHLSVEQINAFGGNVTDGVAGAKILTTPPPGFLRKRNYFDNTVGDYYAKADMRLEMVPDRRNAAKTIIPFNFTSITTGGTETCVTTLPTQPTVSTAAPRVSIARDPANNYIDPDRKNASNLKCNVFTKGQLQSLRQPVLVWTHTKQSAGLQASERDILKRPTLPTPATLAGDKDRILRALQVALVSTPSPITLDQLGTAFGDSIYNSGDLSAFKTEFKRLTGLTDANIATVSPNQVAAMQGAWFMPAPIQVVEPASNANIQDAANNTRGSGFYDGRERRWMNVLQTNIASLSVWNRDGLYVEASASPLGTVTDIDANLTTAYATNNAMKNAAFNTGTGANFTDGLAFTRSEVAAFAAAVPAITPKGLQTLGLGSMDTTEQGLVLHATVNDDLNGDNVIDAATTGASTPNPANKDVSLDEANPVYKKNIDGTDALKKNADGSNFLDASGNTVKIIIDYPRKYKNSDTRKSPFGFAFNGGNYLPGALTLVSDQPVYTQGDFNNNGATSPPTSVNVPSPTRLPASVIGDTITVLSNECLSNSATVTTKNDLLVPKGQISCAVSPLSVTPTLNRYYAVTNSTAVNAAFLSSIPESNGNLPSPALATATNYSRGYGVGTNKFSGGLNNYIRMLENWGGGTSGKYFNYSGSFVSLSTPLESSGTYAGGNPASIITASGVATFYHIPVRNFNFDENFSNFQQLPPLSPRAVYLQQDVFKRAY